MASEKRNDLISRKALLSEYDRVHIGEPGKARKLIADAPTIDAVEVVRCKDCKHSKWYPDDNIRLCNNSNGLFGNVCDGDYCSKVERKDK